MVVNNAEDFALHGVVRRHIDGLVITPDHQGDGDQNIENDSDFFMGNPDTTSLLLEGQSDVI